MSQYIQVISKIKPKNYQTTSFKILDASDIHVDLNNNNYNILCINNEQFSISGLNWLNNELTVGGDVYIEGSLNVDEALNLEGSSYGSSAYIKQSVYVGDSIYVTNSGYFGKDVYVDDSVWITQSLTVKGASYLHLTQITQSLMVNGSTKITGSFDITGSTYLNGNNYITQSLTIDAPTVITGSTHIVGAINVSQRADIGGDLHVAGSIFQDSDGILKYNIVNIKSAIQIIKQINGVQFNWKSNNKHDYGVIAQQVQKVIPQMVTLNTNTNHKQVSYVKLIPFLLQSIKQLDMRVIKLQSELISKKRKKFNILKPFSNILRRHKMK